MLPAVVKHAVEEL